MSYQVGTFITLVAVPWPQCGLLWGHVIPGTHHEEQGFKRSVTRFAYHGPVISIMTGVVSTPDNKRRTLTSKPLNLLYVRRFCKVYTTIPDTALVPGKDTTRGAARKQERIQELLRIPWGNKHALSQAFSKFRSSLLKKKKAQEEQHGSGVVYKFVKPAVWHNSNSTRRCFNERAFEHKRNVNKNSSGLPLAEHTQGRCNQPCWHDCRFLDAKREPRESLIEEPWQLWSQ